MTAPVKRYFITDKLRSPLPSMFTNSANEKTIVVVNCRFFYIDTELVGEPPNQTTVESILTPQFITMHADFIHDERHLDSMVVFCNEPVVKRKKYKQLGRQREIRIWFKTLDGSTLDIQSDTSGYYIMVEGKKRRIRFILELLLIA